MIKNFIIETEICKKLVTPTIVNVVATASLNQPMNFEQLQKHAEILYDSKRYGGRVAYFKTKGMEGKVSIFLSGKMISIGTKSEKQAFKELKIAAKFIVNKGLAKTIIINPIIQNLVATADFAKSIDVEKLPGKTKAIYEPEQFPGAILRLKEPFKASILIFASGKVVIIGLKSSDQFAPTINRIEEIIAASQ